MSGISSSFLEPCSKAPRRRWNCETFRGFTSARNRPRRSWRSCSRTWPITRLPSVRSNSIRALPVDPFTDALSDVKTKSQPAASAWAQQVLLFALFFAGLMLLHAPLLRLPYFWDEAGYYVPAARDLFLHGTLIPRSTPSNAHPPLVMAWLALAWRVAGYSPLVTRTAMLALSAFTLLGLFRLARSAANLPVAWATTALVAIYPVYFTQSSMAQVDLPAAGFTFWALAAYVEARPWKLALWFSLAALAKETAILAPLALFGWDLLAYVIRPRCEETISSGRSWKKSVQHLILGGAA